MFKIAIIGRPNVGKSTLFNKFVGKKFAITSDFSGVTRDRKEAKAHLSDLEFMAIDTAGLEKDVTSDSLSAKMVQQSQLAIIDADLCLFVLDAKTGVTNHDNYFAKFLRQIKKPTIAIANKCENSVSENGWDGAYYSLGFGEPVGISAEHNLGFGDLYDKVRPIYEKYHENYALEEYSVKPDLQIAILGRPNAGKSTLLNQITRQERAITGETAGITRDSITVDHDFGGKKIRFVDTAGIRKKRLITDDLEQASIADSFRALRFANIAILMIDATSPLDHQDLALANAVVKEGRALLFAINKIDKIKGEKEKFLRELRLDLEEKFAEIGGSCILGISAQSGYHVEKLLNFALDAYAQWQKRITTRTLNHWLADTVLHHPPHLYKGKEVKLKYITQIKTRPPTFAIFTNNVKAVQGSYKRYLANRLRQDFDLGLTPIRVLLRKSDNPYAKKG